MVDFTSILSYISVTTHFAENLSINKIFNRHKFLKQKSLAFLSWEMIVLKKVRKKTQLCFKHHPIPFAPTPKLFQYVMLVSTKHFTNFLNLLLFSLDLSNLIGLISVRAMCITCIYTWGGGNTAKYLAVHGRWIIIVITVNNLIIRTHVMRLYEIDSITQKRKTNQVIVY